MNLKLFSAPETEIGWYWDSHPDEPTLVDCDFCGSRSPCLSSANQHSEEDKFGCLRCLKEGAFQIFHETELGTMLPDHQFRRCVSGNPFQGEMPVFETSGLPAGFSPASFDEMLRTPYFRYLQNENWLVHCSDFMTFLGRWNWPDFQKHAPDGDAETLYESLKVADGGATVGITTPEYSESGTYFAFQCRHCQTLRVYDEFD